MKYIYNPSTVSDLKIAALQAEAEGGLKTGDLITARNRDNAEMLNYWNLTDTIIDGIQALRNAKEKYLPKFIEEQSVQYDMRVQLTKYTNVYRDILETLASKPFEQEVSLVENDDIPIPQSLKDLTEDIDGAGNNLTTFAGSVFFNGINSAIHWIFVDFPDVENKGTKPRTQAEYESAGLRPYWSHVLARNVLEVRSKVINGKDVLTYVRIMEPDTMSGDDNQPADHVRIFERDVSGIVSWELWKKIESGARAIDQKFIRVGAGTISIGRIPLIPFITGRRDGRRFKFLPPLQDAADLSLELYLQESGLKYAKTVSAYAMLAGNGVKPEKDTAGNIKPLAIGPMKVLYAPPNSEGSNGVWQFIQPDPAILSFLQNDIKETIQSIRELGRQPLTAQSGNITVITSAMASGKAKTVVGAWAYGLKDALENAFVITCEWLKISKAEYDPKVNVYTEFDNVMNDGSDVEALNKAREQGDLSQETYWFEFKRRGILSSEFQPDKEREAILLEVPGEGDGGFTDNPPSDDTTSDDTKTGNPPVNPPK